MDWLTHNPIAGMYGPYFLLFYGAVIAVTLIACRGAMRRLDWTAASSSPLPPIPASPDPYEIAYLRGGENELIRAIVFALTQRGFLRIGGDAKKRLIERTPHAPERRALAPVEQSAYDWFSTPRAAPELFIASGLPSHIKAFGVTYEQRLRREHMLTPIEVRARAGRVWLGGAAVIAALGGYKLLSALAQGRHNVTFLIIMGIIALIVLSVICRPSRVSAKGKTYLERLQLAFEKLRTRSGGGGQSRAAIAAPAVAAAASQRGVVDPTLLLTVGLFGVGALAGTAHDDYYQTFHRAAANSSGGGSSSSCGSSCSSSSDSSCDSSSSSSGGCGGGGCGGCGS